MLNEGWQSINLDTGWGFIGQYTVASAIHEIVHCLGWQHTQQRPDRDKYVIINEENIKDGHKINFVVKQTEVYDAVQKCRPYNYE
eukprot:646793-Ditylum_brightwellii.AAC.1